MIWTSIDRHLPSMKSPSGGEVALAARAQRRIEEVAARNFIVVLFAVVVDMLSDI